MEMEISRSDFDALIGLTNRLPFFSFIFVELPQGWQQLYDSKGSVFFFEWVI